MCKVPSRLAPSFMWYTASQEQKFLEEYDAQAAVYERSKADQPNGEGTKADAAAVHPDRKLNPTTRRVLKDRELVVNGPKVIAVHCTHGFNRSGYVMIHFAKRRNPATPLQALLKLCALTLLAS